MSSFPFTASNGGINSQGTVRSYQIFAKKKKKKKAKEGFLLLVLQICCCYCLLWFLLLLSSGIALCGQMYTLNESFTIGKD